MRFLVRLGCGSKTKMLTGIATADGIQVYAREACFVNLRGDPKPTNGRTCSLFRLEAHHGIWHGTAIGYALIDYPAGFKAPSLSLSLS